MARKINAEAVALEIQNSVDYVDAYFKRREINREARAKENPNYLEREKHRQAVLERRVEEQYQDLLRGNVTDPLNWLLRELSSPVVAYQYLPEDADDVSPLGARSAHFRQRVAADLADRRRQQGQPAGLRAPPTARRCRRIGRLGCAARSAPRRGRTSSHPRRRCSRKCGESGQPSYENQTQMLQDRQRPVSSPWTTCIRKSGAAGSAGVLDLYGGQAIPAIDAGGDPSGDQHHRSQRT